MPADFSQLAALAASMQSGQKEVNAATKKETRTAAKNVQRTARALAPEDTGELKREIKPIVRGNFAMVRSNSRQGYYQEHGWSDNPGQPHMVPALEAERPKYEKALETAAYEAVLRAVDG